MVRLVVRNRRTGYSKIIADFQINDEKFNHLEKKYHVFGGVSGAYSRYKGRNNRHLLKYLIHDIIECAYVIYMNNLPDEFIPSDDYKEVLTNKLIDETINFFDFYTSLVVNQVYCIELTEEECNMVISLDTDKISMEMKKEEHSMVHECLNRYKRNPEENKQNPLYVEITKIVVHNDKIMIVHFKDGTFTKAVCSDNDTFNFDAGFQVCLLKKLYGEKEYHRYMRKTRKFYDDQEKYKQQKIDEKKKRCEEQEKRHQKNLKKRYSILNEFKDTIYDAVTAAINDTHEERKDDDDSK